MAITGFSGFVRFGLLFRAEPPLGAPHCAALGSSRRNLPQTQPKVFSAARIRTRFLRRRHGCSPSHRCQRRSKSRPSSSASLQHPQNRWIGWRPKVSGCTRAEFNRTQVRTITASPFQTLVEGTGGMQPKVIFVRLIFRKPPNGAFRKVHRSPIFLPAVLLGRLTNLARAGCGSQGGRCSRSARATTETAQRRLEREQRAEAQHWRA